MARVCTCRSPACVNDDFLGALLTANRFGNLGSLFPCPLSCNIGAPKDQGISLAYNTCNYLRLTFSNLESGTNYVSVDFEYFDANLFCGVDGQVGAPIIVHQHVLLADEERVEVVNLQV